MLWMRRQSSYVGPAGVLVCRGVRVSVLASVASGGIAASVTTGANQVLVLQCREVIFQRC